MSLTQHKFLSSVLVALSITLIGLLLVTVSQASRYRADVRYAHDLVEGFHSKRDLALKAELPETIEYLKQLHFPEGQPSPFTTSLASFVETQRRRSVQDVIVYLCAKTGKDLGNNPDTWIQAYGKK